MSEEVEELRAWRKEATALIKRLTRERDEAEQAASAEASERRRALQALFEAGKMQGDAQARIAKLEEALDLAATRFEFLAVYDNTMRNGVIPSVGAADARATLAKEPSR